MSYVYIQSERCGQKISEGNYMEHALRGMLYAMGDNWHLFSEETRARADQALAAYVDLYTVGFYSPDGKWEPESDFSTRDEAAARVAYLNGGGKQLPDKLAAFKFFGGFAGEPQ